MNGVRWALLIGLAASLLIAGKAAASAPAAAAPAAPEKAPKVFREIQTSCDSVASETGPKGQFVCNYVCRDTERTKLAVVYSNSGSGQCRSPISRTIKQTVKPP